jgi:hypothetical protein
VVERWHQLPLDHALARMPVVRALVQALADEVADAEGRPHVPVPDLGPAVVMDQLAVMVFDARAVDQPGCTSTHTVAGRHTVADRLAALRRSL